MKLIVGLGNPGTRYSKTRHNVGFLAIDKLAEFFKVKSFKSENNYIFSDTEYKEETIVLMKPLTYMNLSGTALQEFYEKYEVEKKDILVIYDDVNIDFGVLRLRPSGSDGGQKGMQSIIYHLQDENIARLRIGIKNNEELEKFLSGDKYDLAGYVLSDFTPGEMNSLGKILDTSVNAVVSYIENGLTVSMNNYNRNILEDPKPLSPTTE
ncbi:MAG: aminoacyl-tRNA hydrolase [Ignavibacteriae bacterium]|nr:MAG: aminoacyl-tRNA hydrolase [Ignavibacteriota bacterium]